jgi:hypothetical protein
MLYPVTPTLSVLDTHTKETVELETPATERLVGTVGGIVSFSDEVVA